MKYSQGSIGRVFVLRLEDGEIPSDTLETFAAEHDVKRGLVFYVGGSGHDSRLVVGPDANRDDAIIPLVYALTGAHETLAVGTIFPSEDGKPSVHLHVACGREGAATVGCARAGFQAWLVGEVVLLEIVGSDARRERDATTGFDLLTMS